MFCVFFFKQKTAYEMRISDWSSDVCSSDLVELGLAPCRLHQFEHCSRMKALGQTFDLIGIEDRIGLQHPARSIGPFAGIGRFNLLGVARSEERRVGKECVSTCRSRWSP